MRRGEKVISSAVSVEYQTNITFNMICVTNYNQSIMPNNFVFQFPDDDNAPEVLDSIQASEVHTSSVPCDHIGYSTSHYL